MPMSSAVAPQLLGEMLLMMRTWVLYGCKRYSEFDLLKAMFGPDAYFWSIVLYFLSFLLIGWY
jgi:hypothetical protein